MPGGEKGGKEGKFGGGNGVEEGLTRGAGGATMAGMWRSSFRAPGQAWMRRKRCRNSKTLYWNPAGIQPRPAKLASSRKRVLRGPW